MKILKGNSGNSVLLAVVKAFTTVSGILSTMIMSHALSLELYGTFSQTNLIVTTATNITALGLVDAVNYFYNRSNDEKVQKAYINTIMGFQTITGIVAGVLIIVLSNNLVEYFNNPMLLSFFWLIAFRPFTTIFFMVKTSFPKWVIRHHLLFDLIDAFCNDEKSSV